MSEPRRLLSDSETSELSRSLLTAGRARREPEGARERVWGAVAVGVAGGAAAGTTAGTVGGAAAAGASGGAKGAGVALAITKMKLLVVGSVIATAATVTAVAVRHDEPAAPVTATTTSTTATTAATATKPADKVEAVVVTAPEAKPEAPTEPEPSAKPLASVPPRPRVVEAPVAPTATEAERETTQAPAPISKLREEAALLQEARAALGRGDTAVARTKLEDARSRFPKSQLAQERDALDVRLASESGDRARAASLARAFVEHYPDSPLRGSVESFARTEEKQ